MGSMEFVSLGKGDYPQFLALYEEAFPVSERRPYEDEEAFGKFAADKEGVFHVLAAKEGDRLLGFLSYWTFPAWTYVEHFAVQPEMRGRNIGSLLLKHLIDNVSRNVLLEVERPCEGALARRRIAFYERHGFQAAHHVDYIQPPYSPELSPMPLLLMTHGTVDLTDLTQLRQVYPLFK